MAVFSYFFAKSIRDKKACLFVVGSSMLRYILMAVQSHPLHFFHARTIPRNYIMTANLKARMARSFASPCALRGFSPKEGKVELCGRCEQSWEQRPKGFVDCCGARR